jgi:hypothetical protein
MNPFDLILTACATFAACCGLDALQAYWRHHRHTRRHP